MKKTINKNQLLGNMFHANEEASLILKPFDEETWEEYEKCTFAFFPGCRLGAIEPEFILRTYDTILAKQPDTAIMLRCCGFPAELTDETDLRDASLSQISDVWNALGMPVIITVCDTCAQLFGENLPEIKTISLNDFLGDPVPSQIAKMLLENDILSEEEKFENRAFLKEELENFF